MNLKSIAGVAAGAKVDNKKDRPEVLNLVGLVKEAIFRASRRLDMPISRARDIWYGDARRIDAEEMDRLRRVAEEAELAQALAALEFLKNKGVASSSDQAITKLRAAMAA